VSRTSAERSELEALADLSEVQVAYEDVKGERQRASDEALLATLERLGVPVSRLEDVPDALRHERDARLRSALEPVTVAWRGQPAHLVVRAPEGRQGESCLLEVRREDGSTVAWTVSLGDQPVDGRFDLEGERFVQVRVALPGDLPVGYHAVAVELGGARQVAHLLCAPLRPRSVEGLRTWGVFAPTYALHVSGEAGAGHLGHLRRLVDFTGSLGGGVVGTLPLLAAFLDDPFEPSPYAPASRLAWNELFLDLQALPEWAEGQGVWAAPPGPGAAGMVDYAAHWARVRPVLDACASAAFAQGGTRDALAQFAEAHPDLDGYARFRAVLAEQGRPWSEWPERARDGTLSESDGDPLVYRRHLYGQWRLTEQVDALADHARSYGPGLYLDFPLGVHPAGYDVWRERDAFVRDVAAGAPPDDFFDEGQNWGFPPPHPRAIREDGYRYVAASVRSQLRRAGMLRIDHVMWMHRLFFIPSGMAAREGVYVRYRPDELYAVLAIESERHGSILVGEDLGTVPPEVREHMGRHGVLRMFVLQMAGGPQAASEAPAECVASLNTHDMPPFAAYMRDREELAEAPRVLRRALADLGDSAAKVVLVSLEDLWLEERPQNVPGTGAEQPNWRGRMRLGLDALAQAPEVIEPLGDLNRRRRAGP
jgi:4-alpha-glucanotransferase